MGSSSVLGIVAGEGDRLANDHIERLIGSKFGWSKNHQRYVHVDVGDLIRGHTGIGSSVMKRGTLNDQLNVSVIKIKRAELPYWCQ